MKKITKLLKQVGLVGYGKKGYTEQITQIERTHWTLLRLGYKTLGARRNPITQNIEIFEEGAIDPTYVIPRRFYVDAEAIGFTKCKVCGNLAVFNKNKRAMRHRVRCIQEPLFHEYVVDDLNLIKELGK